MACLKGMVPSALGGHDVVAVEQGQTALVQVPRKDNGARCQVLAEAACIAWC